MDSVDLGCSKAHISLSDEYEYSDLGDMRKAEGQVSLGGRGYGRA